MPQLDLNSIPEYCRLPVARAMEFEGIAKREIYNRMRPGDAHELAWALAPNPGSGPREVRVIDARTLTLGTAECPGGRDRWLRVCARERMERSEFFNPQVSQSSPGAATPTMPAAISRPDATGAAGLPAHAITETQGNLFLSEVGDRMRGDLQEKLKADQRLRWIEPIANGKWRKTHSSKGAYMDWLVGDLHRAGHAVTSSTLYRYLKRYNEAGQGVLGLKALRDKDPGPAPTGARNLESWMKIQIQIDRQERFSREQCYERILKEIGERQPLAGSSHTYPVPSRWGVFRYFASLGPLHEKAMEGRSALKSAAMQIHRTYDCRSLDRVDNDEWITDVFSYDPDALLWRAGRNKGKPRVGRFYLLTLLDERSIYPLEASLEEFPGQEDEIDLLVSVCLNYGVPGLINSDRGRFRGKLFGGEFRQFDREKARASQNGILDKLEIGRNMPREHNPQGNRLERFHLELARFSRTLPGWCGASTEERDELSSAAEALKAHGDYCHGRAKSTPLLSREELLQRYQEFFRAWRDEHQSEGTDMCGLTPSVVFRREAPPEGFRRVTMEELDRATARAWPGKLIQAGGTVEISEGNYARTIYYSHELLLIQGEKRTVERSRIDRSKIRVLPARPGEAEIVAPVMPRVGVADPEHHGRAMAEKTFSRHLIAAAVNHPARSAPPLPNQEGKPAGRGGVEVIPSSRERISRDEFFESPRTMTSEEVARGMMELGSEEGE